MLLRDYFKKSAEVPGEKRWFSGLLRWLKK
jgi:hypothetical protein